MQGMCALSLRPLKTQDSVVLLCQFATVDAPYKVRN